MLTEELELELLEIISQHTVGQHSHNKKLPVPLLFKSVQPQTSRFSLYLFFLEGAGGGGAVSLLK